MATMSENIEKRSFVFNVGIEKREDGTPEKITGHAAIFNEYTDIGWFMERIMPGAFKDSIKSDDIRALFNHDPNYVLGRNIAKTLTLKEDRDGLAIEIDPPDTTWARDLMHSIDRGDISQMSFGFQTIEDKWEYSEKEGEPDKRDLIKVRLFDVSPVTFPAYEGTDVAVRSWKEQKPENKAHKRLDTYRRRTDLHKRRYGT